MINYYELIELTLLVWRVKFNNLTLKGLIFIYEHLLHFQWTWNIANHSCVIKTNWFWAFLNNKLPGKLHNTFTNPQSFKHETCFPKIQKKINFGHAVLSEFCLAILRRCHIRSRYTWSTTRGRGGGGRGGGGAGEKKTDFPISLLLNENIYKHLIKTSLSITLKSWKKLLRIKLATSTEVILSKWICKRKGQMSWELVS